MATVAAGEIPFDFAVEEPIPEPGVPVLVGRGVLVVNGANEVGGVVVGMAGGGDEVGTTGIAAGGVVGTTDVGETVGIGSRGNKGEVL